MSWVEEGGVGDGNGRVRVCGCEDVTSSYSIGRVSLL